MVATLVTPCCRYVALELKSVDVILCFASADWIHSQACWQSPGIMHMNGPMAQEDPESTKYELGGCFSKFTPTNRERLNHGWGGMFPETCFRMHGTLDSGCQSVLIFASPHQIPPRPPKHAPLCSFGVSELEYPSISRSFVSGLRQVGLRRLAR